MLLCRLFLIPDKMLPLQCVELCCFCCWKWVPLRRQRCMYVYEQGIDFTSRLESVPYVPKIKEKRREKEEEKTAIVSSKITFQSLLISFPLGEGGGNSVTSTWVGMPSKSSQGRLVHGFIFIVDDHVDAPFTAWSESVTPVLPLLLGGGVS